MELKLTDGRYSASPVGGLEIVGGTQEIAQRIIMKLTARRGGLALLPQYGSRLHLLSLVKPSERDLAAKQYVAEALSDEPGLSLEELETGELSDGWIPLKLRFRYQNEKISVETRAYTLS